MGPDRAPEAAFKSAPLFIWLSPAFPVGGFAYSHGLEAAVEAGLVHDAATLSDWIDGLARFGSIRQDAILLAQSWQAARTGDADLLRDANDLALALCPGRERRLETGAMGNAFVATLRASWPDAVAPELPAGDIAYPAAVGAASGRLRLDRHATVEMFTLAFVANLVSAAVRLGPIGQTDGQRVTAAMLPVASDLAQDAPRHSLDEIGGCAFRSDLATLQHETQYSRLFRS